MRDEKLSEIIKRKEFKNFWYCFEYLMLAGYPQDEAIGHSLNVFKESTIFTSVAFIAMHKVQKEILIRLDDVDKLCRPSVLKIGLFDESNIDLEPMISVYRKWLAASNKHMWQKQLEEPFEKISYENLSEKTLKYLLKVSKKHYGFEPFTIIPPDKDKFSFLSLPPPQGLPDIEEIRRQMFDIIGIPPNVLGQNNGRII